MISWAAFRTASISFTGGITGLQSGAAEETRFESSIKPMMKSRNT